MQHLCRLSASAWLAACLILAGLLQPEPVLAQTAAPKVQSEYEAGWVNDALGMRHFSGLSCPNRLGDLTRTKVLAAARTRLAGCIYTSERGMQLVIRQHAPDTGRDEAKRFADAYQKAGYALLRLSGVAEQGITFRTGGTDERALLESFWHLKGRSSDYSLWISYNLPDHETVLEPAFQEITEQLARLR
ncbi:hypothetical protein [Pannonibacter sp.]|uniref:hypothetical protein n=1 Tax=Pannonibacter sp. TaxID=1906786 RepID=UPI003F72F84A